MAKIRGDPQGSPLTWGEMIALPVGSTVRDFDGETGDVEERTREGRTSRMIAWDDCCFTSFSGKPLRKTGVWLLRLPKERND